MANVSQFGSFGDQSGSGLMFRNRVINGNMAISQRWGTTSVSVNTSQYVLDRFRVGHGAPGGGVISVQQVVDGPPGFVNSLKNTVTTAATPAAGDLIYNQHYLEGYNVADFEFGTTNAKVFTLSFWVKSSLTGTFPIGFINSASDRSYVSTYTINAANTWEKKVITVQGDTTGTWPNNSSAGFIISWSVSVGSTYRTATANAWVAGRFYAQTGTPNMISTNGATLNITGVQFEMGPMATPFEQRPYGLELSLCQRYYMTGTFAASGAFDTSYNSEGMSISFSPMRRVPDIAGYNYSKEGHNAGSETLNPANYAVNAYVNGLTLRWNSSSPHYRATGYYGTVTPKLSAEY
jgi:hypothetical protein